MRLASRYHDIWHQRFEGAMVHAGKIFTNWRLVCSTSDGLTELRGPEVTARPIKFSEELTAQVHSALAGSGDDAVALVRKSSVRVYGL